MNDISTDIVGRLRDWPKMTPVACKEAADEIERLRTLLAERDHEISLLKLSPMSVIAPITPRAPVSPRNVPETAASIGAAMWGDRIVDGTPVGFWCRKCNVRVRTRHTDPRLLCAACLGRHDEVMSK